MPSNPVSKNIGSLDRPITALLLEASQGKLPLDQRLLRAMVERREESIDSIVKVALASQDDWRIDFLPDLVDLARHFNHPRLTPVFLKALERDESLEEAFEGLSALGASGVDPLLRAYETANEDMQGEIAFALAATGVKDDRIRTLLESRATDEEESIALELYNDPEAKASEPLDLFTDLPETGEPIVEVLSTEERIAMLGAEAEETRIACAASLFGEEFSKEEEDTLFAVAKSDPSELVRANLWQALHAAVDRDEIRQAMLERAEKQEYPTIERCGALVGLAPVAAEPQVRDAIMHFYGIPEVRFKAIEAMWRSGSPEFAAIFPQHLDDADEDIRRLALRGVGTLGIRSELGRVRAAIKEESVREDALFAYALLAPAKDSAAYLRPLLKKIIEEAGGVSEDEENVIRMALDQRLEASGKPPIFSREQDEE